MFSNRGAPERKASSLRGPKNGLKISMGLQPIRPNPLRKSKPSAAQMVQEAASGAPAVTVQASTPSPGGSGDSNPHAMHVDWLSSTYIPVTFHTINDPRYDSKTRLMHDSSQLSGLVISKPWLAETSDAEIRSGFWNGTVTSRNRIENEIGR